MRRDMLVMGLVGLLATGFLLGTAATSVPKVGAPQQRSIQAPLVPAPSTDDLIEFATGRGLQWQMPTAGAEMLAWSASYAVLTDVELYLAIGDRTHLARTSERARELMGRPSRDEQGRALGWQQSNKAMNIVHQGMLAHAALRVLTAPKVELVLSPEERTAWQRDLTDVLNAEWIAKLWREEATGSFYMGFSNPTPMSTTAWAGPRSSCGI